MKKYPLLFVFGLINSYIVAVLTFAHDFGATFWLNFFALSFNFLFLVTRK